MILVLPARAKLNLELQVLSRQPDGQHEVATVLQAIDLHDLLSVAPATETALEVSGLELAAGSTNLVLAAARALEEAEGRSLPAAFRLLKRIPPGSGLGGASSDAAAALRGLKVLYNLDTDLRPLAERLGADVPFFLRGGRALAEGRGERLHPLPMAGAAWYAIAWPGVELSTAAVYEAWDASGGEGRNHLQRAALTVRPELGAFAERLGPGWQMTGSGSAFFRECGAEAEARQKARGLECWTAVTRALGPWA